MCNKSTCLKTNLVRHSESVQHLEQLNKNKENINVNVSDNNNNRVTLSHVEKVKRTEIKLATFFAEYNISFYFADHLRWIHRGWPYLSKPATGFSGFLS